MAIVHAFIRLGALLLTGMLLLPGTAWSDPDPGPGSGPSQARQGPGQSATSTGRTRISRTGRQPRRR